MSSPDPAAQYPEREALEAIVAADGHVRARLLNDFARSKLPDMRSIALQLCRIAGLDPMVHGDDAVGIVETQFTMLCNAIIADPTRMDRITAFNGYLYHHTKAAMRSYADGAQSGEKPSGTTSLARRQRELNRTQAALRAELNAEPTPEQIVEVTNARMRAKRKDAKREGMISTVEDLQQPTNVPLLPEENDAPVWMHSDAPLAPHEARKFLTVAIARAMETDERLARVLGAWLGSTFDEAIGAPRPVSEVAALMGMRVAETAELIAAAQDLAVRVLVNEFGVRDTREPA
ncbi:hypothetical protein CHO01_28970 [Cellulomonas hominis]|uniref:Uncharacterized protein n=1 Tax=Cellulomonas hominis TaxID=156981 RepID=A0A511FEX3_9CELL|nr:hypothetical protein [Cellulomonas hominis]MBB5474753.1 hypothetical protein [Cellulomonas hominis]NKY05409.1 hypothetical protein [Cellulomonas hominis]GEL47781.1 hypothetical protein CHO01_28970 [Cellulomonas hominis]